MHGLTRLPAKGLIRRKQVEHPASTATFAKLSTSPTRPAPANGAHASPRANWAVYSMTGARVRMPPSAQTSHAARPIRPAVVAAATFIVHAGGCHTCDVSSGLGWSGDEREKDRRERTRGRATATARERSPRRAFACFFSWMVFRSSVRMNPSLERCRTVWASIDLWIVWTMERVADDRCSVKEDAACDQISRTDGTRGRRTRLMQVLTRVMPVLPRGRRILDIAFINLSVPFGNRTDGQLCQIF